jgi:hypothetical protein
MTRIVAALACWQSCFSGGFVRLPLEGAAGSLWVLPTGAPWVEPPDRFRVRRGILEALAAELKLSDWYPLAQLQLGRARAFEGDSAKARLAYQDFFAAWKNSDPDIPVLVTAKAEYAKLQ